MSSKEAKKEKPEKKIKTINHYGTSEFYRKFGYLLFALEIALTTFFLVLLILITIIAPKEGLLDLVLTIIHSTLFVLVMEIRGDMHEDLHGDDHDFRTKRLPRRIVFIISVLILDIAVLMKHIYATDFETPLSENSLYIALLSSSIFATANSGIAGIWVIISLATRKTYKKAK
jgi:hypothetical protein